MRLFWTGIPVVAGASLVLHLVGAAPLGVLAISTAGYCAIAALAADTLSRLRRHAAESQRLALLDPVTDLPNRTLFHDRVHQALTLAKRRGNRLAVILLDLDRFKEINDTLGHHSGDLLLYMVGERLSATARESDSVARLGGDEFAVLLPEVGDAAGAIEAADRLLGSLSELFEVQGVALEVEASAGVALFPEHGEDPDLLLQRADVAMYWAKRNHSGVDVYSGSRDEHSRERLELVAELRHGIENGELVLHYQPKSKLSSSAVVGVEALVRWNHPVHGFMAPDSFIPLAETTGLIGPLTMYVLDEALRQCREWKDQGIDLAVAVNLSTRNLVDISLPGSIAGLLAKHGIDPSRLEVEVTETAIMVDPLRAADVLEKISELGIEIAIDDFGTGYTSLSWLKRLPVSTLKIDRSFVTDMTADEGDAVIVRSTIHLAQDLGLGVVAEGIEHREAWDELSKLGCDLGQGFLMAKPMPGAEIVPWVRGCHGHSPEPDRPDERDQAGEGKAASSVSIAGLSAAVSE
jgi:diguanylate cyclase (GGDEF)-like protein